MNSMDTFDMGKKNALTKDDKSKIGSIDQNIKNIVNLINLKDNFYTTSSCSGRIVLLKEPLNSKKSRFEWIYVTHDTGCKDALKKTAIALRETEEIPEEIVRLRSEPFILHVCCKTMKDAEDLLDITFNSGIRRAGIMMVKKRIMIEIIGANILDTPISKAGKFYPDDEYLDLLICTAEEKLVKNHKQINRFYDNLIQKF